MVLETSKKIALQNEIGHSAEGRARSQKAARLGFLALAGLGMVIFLLSGCGSDSTPKGDASAKKEKAAKSGATTQTVTPLLFPKEVGTAPPLPHLDKIPGGISPEELEAKRAAGAWDKLSPKAQVLPGLTKEQLEAKLDAERASKKANPSGQVLPGLSQEQLDAKLKAHREQQPSPSAEMLPGLTEEQMKAKAAQNRQIQESEGTRPEQAFPSK